MFLDVNKCIYKDKILEISAEAQKIKDIIKFERYREKGMIFKWLNKAPGGVWSLALYHINGLESVKQSWIERNQEIQENLRRGIPMDESQVQVQLTNLVYEDFPEFDKIKSIINSIPGCFQSFINFVEPNSLIIKHTDKHVVAADGVEFYPCIIAVNIPSNDPSRCALNVGGIPCAANDGDIMIIDGSTEHWGYNHTDGWRITLILDLNKRSFYLD